MLSAQFAYCRFLAWVQAMQSQLVRLSSLPQRLPEHSVALPGTFYQVGVHGCFTLVSKIKSVLLSLSREHILSAVKLLRNSLQALS